jgi:hypothetical protein
VALAAPSLVRTAPPASLLEWWHLLSLDAPTVAGLWSYAFARAMGLHLPPLAPLLLAAGTWLVYVADRILDGLQPQPNLRKRHYFYAEHRFLFLALATAVACCLTWFVFTRMQPNVRREDSLVFVTALVYFLLVHAKGQRVERWLPKELAVGLLFAAATAVPTWARLTTGRDRLLPAVVLFAALCWLNCVAIESWERGLRVSNAGPLHSPTPHLSTQWAAGHLRSVSAFVALSAALLAANAWLKSSPDLSLLYLASFASAGLFVLLDTAEPRLTSLQLRIAADAALLTPLPLLYFFRA